MTSRWMLRLLTTSLIMIFAGCAMRAQPLDSVHVFVKLPAREYTSAGANALAWRSHRTRAEHITLNGDDIAEVYQALAAYRQVPHRSGPVPGLRYIAMAYSHGRPTALGMTEDLDRLIDFTSRREYRVSSLAGHLKIRAVLLELMIDR